MVVHILYVVLATARDPEPLHRWTSLRHLEPQWLAGNLSGYGLDDGHSKQGNMQAVWFPTINQTDNHTCIRGSTGGGCHCGTARGRVRAMSMDERLQKDPTAAPKQHVVYKHA